LDYPMGLTVDLDGTLYFLDSHNVRIRKVDERGTITTVAGTGTIGLPPDGTPAAKAQFGPFGHDHSPAGLALGRGGVLLFPDIGNSRVRMIDARGLVRTVAGNGEIEFSGDGGPATEAGLLGPLDVAIDAEGNIYIGTHDHTGGGGQDLASGGSNRVRMVTPKGIITTVAGSDKTGYSGDGGPARRATLAGPKGLACAPGNLYVADTENHLVRRIHLESGMITTVLGTGRRGDGPEPDPLQCALSRPHGVHVAGNTLYVGDSEAHRIRVLK